MICKNQEFLPFSFQLLALSGILLCQFALTYGSHHDGCLVAARHGTQVVSQVLHCHLHALPVVLTIADGIIRPRQEECILLRSRELHKLFCCLCCEMRGEQYARHQKKFLHAI